MLLGLNGYLVYHSKIKKITDDNFIGKSYRKKYNLLRISVTIISVIFIAFNAPLVITSKIIKFFFFYFLTIIIIFVILSYFIFQEIK